MHHIWRAFKGADTGTLRDDLRNELVGAYHYLVKVIGNRIAARLPRSIDVQDLRSAGVFGLMRAIENYDIERGTPFASYCATRVRGAILDELRAQDWVPRLVRNRAGTFNEAVLRLQKRLGRDPSNHEVGQVLRMGADEIEKLRRESNLVSVFTLNQAEGDDDDPQSLRKLDALMDRGSSQPFDSMVARDLTQAMMNSLARNERTVIALYYHEGLTMKEIGRVMRISESRVCQIHTKTLKKLKEQIDAINQGEPAETPPTPPRFRAGRRPRTSVQ
ncbi:MAG: FliA/WhiG family RNA polymerase sigma factor [Planctomycetota bacterium]|nr:FliA/WhiG family RNA polymerase sigma factor [Planctomycetota bacterium]